MCNFRNFRPITSNLVDNYNGAINMFVIPI